MDVIERIKSQLSTNPVLLYMKGTPDFPQCGFSATAVRALTAVGATFGHVNIFEDPELREARVRPGARGGHASRVGRGPGS